jgi:diacylglycerol kinase (ATP)
MKCKIIYNPTSGNESFKYDLVEIIEALSRKEYSVEVSPTQRKEHATSLASQACEDNIDLIIVSGGDGTLNEVLNGLMQYTLRPKILFIPSGTTNDLAHTLMLPKDPIKCLELLKEGNLVKMDVGKINDKYFSYIAASGAFTKITYSTSSQLKTHLGYFAYLLSSIEEIPKLDKPNHYRITIDDEVIEDDYVFIMISNSTGFGGFKNIFRETKLNDGEFDVTLVPKANIKIVGDAITGLVSGLKHDKDMGFIYKSGSNITVECSKDTKWNIDGELGPVGVVKIENIKKAFEIYVPKKTKKRLF